MKIERTSKEIILTLPGDIDIGVLQRIVNYLKFNEATKDSQATEEEANALADESKKDWWRENKGRFVK
jgi:hypothetical protein